MDTHLPPAEREELRKLTASIIVRPELDAHVMARFVEQGLARRVFGGWEITEDGWAMLERTRIPNALI